jgi:formate dehydrogenase subunit gamma
VASGEPSVRKRTWSEERTRAIAASFTHRRAPLMLILQALQSEFGYVDERATPILAEALNISRAEVHGVRTFYHDFTDEPEGATVVRVCTAESCQSVGSDSVVEHLTEAFGVKMGETTPDGAYTLRHVFCLGNCALSPAMLVGSTLVGRIDPDEAAGLVRSGGRR